MSIDSSEAAGLRKLRKTARACDTSFNLAEADGGTSMIFTCARQCLSSWMSKDSTPGIVFAICAGSFKTCQTVSGGASNCFSPVTFIDSPH